MTPRGKWAKLDTLDRKQVRRYGGRGLCEKCYRRAKHTNALHRYPPGGATRTKSSDADIALTGGRWVSKGLIKVWEPTPTPTVSASKNVLSPLKKRENLKKRDAQHPKPAAKRSNSLCHCGCLLTSDNCPACRVWAYENEKQHNVMTFRKAA